MKIQNKIKNKLSKILFGSSLLFSSLLGGCRSEDESDNGNGETLNPVISEIPDQVVREGSSLSLNLNDYVSNSDGEPVTISKISGVGSINPGTGIIEYLDPVDDDKVDDIRIIEINARDPSGHEANASFNIVQEDNHYRVNATFLDSEINWISYSPTNYNPDGGVFPTEASIRQDLQTLRNANFKGVITYGTKNILGNIARIAKEEGMQKVIAGIWDFNDNEELTNAINSQPHVDGYCVGNEGLVFGRYSLQDLETKMEMIRRATDKPVTTTEPLTMYESGLFGLGDWIFPNAHPFWQGIKDSPTAASWTKNQYDLIVAERDSLGLNNLKVLFKEVGLPTAGEAGLSEADQEAYYRHLEDLMGNWKSEITNPAAINPPKFSYFEAFDQPWKNWHAAEPHWGLFNSDRTPKSVSKPGVRFVEVPAIGSYSPVLARSLNVRPENHRGLLYIKVEGNWWVKPYANSPLTAIKENSGIRTYYTTGGIDQTATAINQYLVNPDYIASTNSLPDMNDPKVKAVVSAVR